MKKGVRYALVTALLSALLSIPAYADDYTVFVPDPEDGLPVFEDIEIDVPFEEASASDATPSNVVMPRGSYGSVYDGQISTSVLQYFRDVVEKLPPDVDYVLFRQSQYRYRMVYSDDLELTSAVFTADSGRYIVYDTSSQGYSWTSGEEGVFRLSASDDLVYRSLGDMYPSLDQGVRRYDFQALLFGLGVAFIAYMLYQWFCTRSHYTL